jgi:molybdopterin-binding protein
MRLSTRNQLSGTVTAGPPGAVTATVEVDVGGQEMTASITEEAVEYLGPSVGSAVVVLVESTEGVLAVEDWRRTPSPPTPRSARAGPREGAAVKGRRR